MTESAAAGTYPIDPLANIDAIELEDPATHRVDGLLGMGHLVATASSWTLTAHVVAPVLQAGDVGVRLRTVAGQYYVGRGRIVRAETSVVNGDLMVDLGIVGDGPLAESAP